MLSVMGQNPISVITINLGGICKAGNRCQEGLINICDSNNYCPY